MRYLYPVLIAAALLTACGKNEKPPAPAGDAAAKPAVKLLLAPEDLLSVTASTLASGPVISGSVQPERRADLRAEVAAVVLQVLKENGEPVKAGDLLVRLDETAIRDSLASAEEAVRAATQAFHPNHFR